MSAFWEWFDQEARPKLGARSESFACALKYLDTLDHAPLIVETGCLRNPESWSGDGQSTLIWAKYAESRRGATVLSVDLDPEAVTACRRIVGEKVQVSLADSRHFLAETAAQGMVADLLYLDSLDFMHESPESSAEHQLEELQAALPMLRSHTLVMVDDAFWKEGKAGGKAKYVGIHAERVGAAPMFLGYQCGWTGMRP